ncbi:histone deacetylase 5 [Senna tora]|uniref:Histone deacetylase 5 n=1 Tax=Senna tora TaxID=362788 RepID=A0A834XFC0_9FABA|nr:histone deacetylase 5 [Senna tora]
MASSKTEVGAPSQGQPTSSAANSWRSELSQIPIWYASYGSNMCEKRFSCYIEGGKVDGMINPCPGSKDPTLPSEKLWRHFPCRLFFGRESTITWGPGGVAFILPETSSEDTTRMCLYKISLEQFNDVLLQENGHKDMDNVESAYFDQTHLDAIRTEEFKSTHVTGRWYGNVVYLGEEENIPILTLTCAPQYIEDFKSEEPNTPLRAPGDAYKNTLIQGLVEEARDYIDKSAGKRPL